MAGILATLYALGGAAGLVMVLDVEPGPARSALALMSGISLLAALAVARWGARWPRRAFHWAVIAATATIGGAVVLAPHPVTSLGAAAVMAFVVVDAHFFFPGRQALAHLGAAVVVVTVALLLSGGVGLGVALGLDVVLVGIGVVIHRLVVLASSASRDALTGLLNRRGFDSALPELMSRAARTGKPLSAVLIDVDHFKSVNDTYGHEEGDRVLCRVAETWRRQLPPGAVLARHGGDEFSLLLPGHRGPQALALVRQVCALDPGISLSCGVAEYRPADSASHLMRGADRALYEAKVLGRGRAELVADTSAQRDGLPARG